MLWSPLPTKLSRTVHWFALFGEAYTELFASMFSTHSYLIMNINHHWILLWWVSSWVQHMMGYIWRVKSLGIFYCLLLSIGEMAIVFILANRIMSRQPIPSCSLTVNRRTENTLKERWKITLRKVCGTYNRKHKELKNKDIFMLESSAKPGMLAWHMIIKKTAESPKKH